ncbi:MAG TPA: response regulator transcription factor [Usitatibacter sp.]|nr:response regulator transcription factor [Usitatibacter sp.]
MPTTRPHNVYIVDDSAPIRDRLTEMLARLDDVRLVGEAANAREAIAGIRRTQPDSVLLDLNLMGMSGLEVLRTIHPEHPRIVFVVLTNHADPQYQRACLQQGASYFLDKSSEFESVPEVLGQIAGHH